MREREKEGGKLQRMNEGRWVGGWREGIGRREGDAGSPQNDSGLATCDSTSCSRVGCDRKRTSEKKENQHECA